MTALIRDPKIRAPKVNLPWVVLSMLLRVSPRIELWPLSPGEYRSPPNQQGSLPAYEELLPYGERFSAPSIVQRDFKIQNLSADYIEREDSY